MKKIFFAFFISLSGNFFGQTAEEKPRHFFAGIAISPDYCFRSLKNNDLSGSSNDVINQRNQTEIPRLGYTAGIVFGYKFKKLLLLETGIRYSLQGYQTKEIFLTTMNGQGMIENAGSVRFKYNYNYLEFPLKANFLFGKKKLRFITGAGLAAGIFLHERQITEIISPTRKTSKTLTNYAYKPFNLYATASAGFDLKLSERLDLKIEPNFKYGLLAIIDDPVTGHLWSAGLNLGLNFSL